MAKVRVVTELGAILGLGVVSKWGGYRSMALMGGVLVFVKGKGSDGGEGLQRSKMKGKGKDVCLFNVFTIILCFYYCFGYLLDCLVASCSRTSYSSFLSANLDGVLLCWLFQCNQ